MFLHFLSYQIATIRFSQTYQSEMINEQAENESEIQNSFFNTGLSTLELLSVPKTQKYCSEDNFFVRATRCANELLKLNVIKLDMLLLLLLWLLLL